MKHKTIALITACGLLHHSHSRAEGANHLVTSWTNNLAYIDHHNNDEDSREFIESKEIHNNWVTSETKLNNPLSELNSTPSLEKNLDAPRVPNPYFIPKRFDMGYAEGSGARYHLGYSKLAMVLAPEYAIGKYLPMINLKAMAFNNGTFSAAGGFVSRFLPKSFCEIFGFNFFYEWRQGKLGNFNQIEAGFEVLNKNWEIRAQGYVPVGQKNYKKKSIFADNVDNYRAERTRNEFANYFVDASAGYYIVNSNAFQIYLAAGPYWFTGKFFNNVWGGQLTIRPQIMDYIELEFNMSYDKVLKTCYQGSIVLTLPLYNYSSAIKKKKGPCGMANRQIYQPVRRDEMILLLQKCCWHINE